MFFFFSSRRRHTRYWRDWSSDVCSSDLDKAGVVEELCADFITVMADDGSRQTYRLHKFRRSNQGTCTNQKIGRASCRGRVEISVVAVSLKKKKSTTQLHHTL